MNNITLDNTELDKIDLKKFDGYLSRKLSNPGEYNFYGESGREHYKMLAYLSTLYSNATFLDVGTYLGGSAFALSYNGDNKVNTIDITNHMEWEMYLENVEFHVGDVYNKSELIDNADLIVYDTVHDGILEQEFHDHLINTKWTGICIWDDIKYRWTGEIRQGMQNFWNGIENEKEEVTKYAHWTGTGIVWYNCEKNITLK